MPSEDELRERRRAHGLARRVIRFLKEGDEWEISFMPIASDERLRKSLGFGDPIDGALREDRNLIVIDHARANFFAVLIHECLHVVYPDVDEKGIQELEDLVRKHLTARQAKHLLIWAANRLR